MMRFGWRLVEALTLGIGRRAVLGIGCRYVNSHFAQGGAVSISLHLSKMTDLKAAEPYILMVAGFGKGEVQSQTGIGGKGNRKEIKSKRGFRKKRCPYIRVVKSLLLQRWLSSPSNPYVKPSLVEKVFI